MWRAGVYLHGHPDIRPLGAWNAGIVGYFADNGVINVDGLMNDSILGYSGTDTLIDYFTLRGIRYVFDAPQLWQPMMAARGGYSDGRLQACILKSVDMFPDDPDNTYVGGHIRLYTFSLACLSTASSELTHR
jgi:hypothetical protein